MNTEIIIPNAEINLDSYDSHCPHCYHILSEYIVFDSEKSLKCRGFGCNSCGWTNSEYLPRIIISG